MSSFFDSFFDGSGFGGPHARGGGSDEEEVDTDKLYDILGVDKKATTREIKKAYKKAALKHHPDAGGDEEKFKEVEMAKQILQDPQKRKQYDRWGLKGVERGGGPMSGGDLFSTLFNQGGRQAPRGPPKPKTIAQTIDITLEDVYKGPAVKKKWKIKTATKRDDCIQCDGNGSVRKIVRQGPMMLQTQRQCDSCGGRGFRLTDEREVERSGTVHIPHGITNGGKITLNGEGHSLPKFKKGDVTFTVRIRKHKIYHRKGADLGCEHTLTLCQALCGYSFRLKHVSGKVLIIQSNPGEVVQPGELKVLKDHGLPQKGNHYIRGHLYIKFKVIFPLASSITPKELSILEKTLSEVDYPEVEEKIELGVGSRVKVKLAANAAQKIYGIFRAMDAYGMIADEKREQGDAWPVELDPLDEDGQPRLVVVPASWVSAHVERSRSRSSSLRKSKSKKRPKIDNENQKEDLEDDEEDDYEDEEEVHLELVTGGTPKPTPAQGGSVHDDDQDERQGGVQCAQM